MRENTNDLVYPGNIQQRILTIRGQKVLLDSDLAELYGVEIKRLNEQVKRNRERFPEDFMFQLTNEEYDSLRSQFATLKRGQHRKYFPFAFTEHGAIMAASVLNSPLAIEMSIFVVRAFVRLREILFSHKELADKISELENKVGDHDTSINSIILAIKQLMTTPQKPKKQIGFLKKTDK
jgi:phage regulator Rha-like protein